MSQAGHGAIGGGSGGSKVLIERCLQLYMGQREVQEALHKQAQIAPEFTQLVWSKLEQENATFFKAYYSRLRLKDQIIMFNYLLDQQVMLMQQARQNSWSAPPTSTAPEPTFAMPSASGPHSSSLAGDLIGADMKKSSIFSPAISGMSPLVNSPFLSKDMDASMPTPGLPKIFSMSEFKDLHDNHSAEGDVKLELAMGSFLGGDGLGHDSMGGFSRVLSLPDMEAFGQEEED